MSQKQTPTQVLSCEFCEIFNNTFLTEHLRWQLTFQIFLRRYMNLPEISNAQIILNAEHKNRTKKFKETSGLQTFKSFTSSRARVFQKTSFLKILRNFSGKHCREVLLSKNLPPRMALITLKLIYLQKYEIKWFY